LLEGDEYQCETLESLSTEALHLLCRDAIEACIQSETPIRQRFNSLKSETGVHKREERTWLLDSLDAWFTKKWNDKRRMDELKKAQPHTKKVVVQVYLSCKKPFHCEDCEGSNEKVFPSFTSSSDLDRQRLKQPTFSLKFAIPTPKPMPSPLIPRLHRLRPYHHYQHLSHNHHHHHPLHRQKPPVRKTTQ
jgi:hypothetical protein